MAALARTRTHRADREQRGDLNKTRRDRRRRPVLVYSVIVYPTELAHGARTGFGWATTTTAVVSFLREVFA